MDEFYAHRSLPLDERIAQLEYWASRFTSRTPSRVGMAASTAGASLNGSTGGTSGGGGGVLAGDVTGPIASNQATNCVILTPDTSARNTIQATADNVTPLTVFAHSNTNSNVLFIVANDPTATAEGIVAVSSNCGLSVTSQSQFSPPLSLTVATGTNSGSRNCLSAVTGRDGSGNTLTQWFVDTTNRMFWQAKSTTTIHGVAAIVPGYFDNVEATRKGQLIFQVSDASGVFNRQPLILSSDGSAPTIGFLGAAAVARPGAYTLSGSATRTFPADPSSAYTGIDNTQVGTPYAQVADLNTLRGVVSTLLGVVRQLQTDLGAASGFGLLAP